MKTLKTYLMDSLKKARLVDEWQKAIIECIEDYFSCDGLDHEIYYDANKGTVCSRLDHCPSGVEVSGEVVLGNAGDMHTYAGVESGDDIEYIATRMVENGADYHWEVKICAADAEVEEVEEDA